MASDEGENVWKFIHPELMSQEELVTALQQRHIRVDEKLAEDKKQLVELFKRVAMPLSQRNCFRKKVSSPVKMDIDSRHHGSTSSQSGSGFSSSSHLMITTKRGHQPQVKESTTGTTLSSVTKVRLKRTNDELSDLSTALQNAPTPKKREKITWP